MECVHSYAERESYGSRLLLKDSIKLRAEIVLNFGAALPLSKKGVLQVW